MHFKGISHFATKGADESCSLEPNKLWQVMELIYEWNDEGNELFHGYRKVEILVSWRWTSKITLSSC